MLYVTSPGLRTGLCYPSPVSPTPYNQLPLVATGHHISVCIWYIYKIYATWMLSSILIKHSYTYFLTKNQNISGRIDSTLVCLLNSNARLPFYLRGKYPESIISLLFFLQFFIHISLSYILFTFIDELHKKYIYIALAGVAQWIECRPANQRVTGLIPSQGTCLGCSPVPQLGAHESNYTLMFLSLSFSLPSPLSISK